MNFMFLSIKYHKRVFFNYLIFVLFDKVLDRHLLKNLSV